MTVETNSHSQGAPENTPRASLISHLEAKLAKAQEEIAGLRIENLDLRGKLQVAQFFKSGGFNVDFAALGLDPSTAFVGLTEEQILEVVNGAQKTRAKIFHPDLGGDNSKMQRVNDAADKLRKPSTRGTHK